MKKVIVLMSAYNGEKYIISQIDSILQQKNVDVELIIRDDGSTDKTLSIIRSYDDSRIKLIEGENFGCSASFFCLLEYAQRNYDDACLFAFSDQDDYWLEDKLSTAVSHLNGLKTSGPKLYISNLFIVDGELKSPKPYYSHPVDLSKQHALIQNHATGCTMVFDKSAINLILTKDTSVFRIHDIPMFLQCLFLGNVVYDASCHILYRQHQNNVIGAGVFFRQRIRSKINSLRNLHKQHLKENDAKVFYSQFKNELRKDDAELFLIVMNYRNNIRYRLKLLCSKEYRKRGFFDNLFYKLRVILGHV